MTAMSEAFDTAFDGQRGIKPIAKCWEAGGWRYTSTWLVMRVSADARLLYYAYARTGKAGLSIEGVIDDDDDGA